MYYGCQIPLLCTQTFGRLSTIYLGLLWPCELVLPNGIHDLQSIQCLVPGFSNLSVIKVPSHVDKQSISSQCMDGMQIIKLFQLSFEIQAMLPNLSGEVGLDADQKVLFSVE